MTLDNLVTKILDSAYREPAQLIDKNTWFFNTYGNQIMIEHEIKEHVRAYINDLPANNNS